MTGPCVGGGVARADLLPRGDHRVAIAGRLVDAAEHVQRVGLELGRCARDLDPARGRLGIARAERELREIERLLGLVDHRGRQLAECLARLVRAVEQEQCLGAHDDGLDQIGLVVDEIERGVDGLERLVGIADVAQLEPRRADPRHRVVGSQLDHRAIVCERGLDVAAGVGDRGRERDHAGVLAIDALAALDACRGVIELACVERVEAAIEIGGKAVLAGHERDIPRFAPSRLHRYRQRVPSSRPFQHALFALAIAVLGCHTGTRKTLVPDVPTNGDPQARSQFLEAKAKFLEDATTSGVAFERIATDFPNDPIVPWADLYAGIASVKAHDYAKADAQLAKVLAVHTNEGVETKARLYLGIAKNYEGDTTAARELLAHADPAIENDDERTEYLAAVAYSLAAQPDDKALAALAYFDQLWPRSTSIERAVMIGRIAAIVQAASPDALAHAYDQLADRRGPSIAIAGGRLALIAEATGDAAGAAKRRADIAPARVAAGLTRSITETTAGALKTVGGAGEPGLLGAVVPLGSKRENRLAEAAVAGLGLAAGATDGKGVAAIETRAAIDKDAAAAAVDQLASQNVIAIVGPIEGVAVDAAGGRAEGLAVPLISLATTPEQRASGPYVFHIRHSAEARARTLAKLAIGKGVTRFAVFAPDSGYGKAVTAAFSAAVEKAGGTIVKRVSYPKDAKSFAKAAKELGDGFQAVFVPDTAETLALAAPAIAAAGNVPKPMPFPKRVLGGRPILLLSTAEDLTAEFLNSAGHNADGALLAPGFYPDDADPVAKPFLDRFVLAYGHAPGAGEAYAYDAAELVASARSGSRSALASALSTGTLGGVTGTIKFDADHRRADPGVVYTVVEETGGTWAIRVARRE